jgi:chorismate mutase/prephenate dehydratase
MTQPPQPPTDLASLRTRIDALDRELLEVLNRRAALALEVGELKKRDGSPVFRPEREAQVIDALKAANPGPLAAESVAPIWREIMSACRSLEAPLRVAFLGPAGTFSELAALGYFGSSIVRVPCTSIDEVFRATSGGAADFGVVPVENSTEGVVARSLDLFLNTPLTIVGETSLYVRHNLLRKVEGVDGLKAVCAHPQALAQCHTWLNDHLPQVERRLIRHWPASRASAPPASTACTRWPLRSRTTRTTARASPSWPCRRSTRGRAHRVTTAPASWCRCRTSPVRSTTCWCR